jgi:photosystem II stability/assembly factor-like uncharacterized protein
MAVVYRARQRSLDRSVALKVLLLGGRSGTGEQTRIRTEAEAIARLQHPNVVHVYEVGEQNGCPYLLMEFVDGGTLADRLRGRPVPPRQAAVWTEAIARGIHAAHRRGVVHRDLKPANVLLTSDGIPKITDFGIARRIDGVDSATRTGVVMGTPAYMSPEQAEGKGKSAGPAADVWAVGVILYEMLAGRPPFVGESAIDVLHGVVYEPASPPSQFQPGIPAALEAICLKCLLKRPEERYTSAETVADELARWLANRGEDAVADDRQARRRWMIPIVAGGALLLLLVAGLSVWPGCLQNPVAVSSKKTDETPQFANTETRGEPIWERFWIAKEDKGFQQIAFPSRNTGFAVSRTGVHRTGDGGQTWRRVYTKDLGVVHFLKFDDEVHGWFGSDQLYRTTNGGDSWDRVPLPGGEGLTAVRAGAFDTSGRGLAGGSAAGELVLYRRQAGADLWEKLDPVATGLWGSNNHPFRNWSLGGLAMAGPANAWATLSGPDTEAGVLLYTTDGGDSWKEAFRTDTYLRHVHFVDLHCGWLSGFRGKLWRTEDGGRSWTVQKNPSDELSVSSLAFAQSGEPVAVAPLWKGLALWTDDGQTWQTIETGLDYATPAAVIVDRGRAYVLGADGQIARYTNPRIPPQN